MYSIEERKEHYNCQMELLEIECRESDRAVTRMSVYFFPEITESFGEEDMQIDIKDAININQLLYMLNANYYDYLASRFKDNNREQIIMKFLEQIRMYLLVRDQRTFDVDDAISVINNCFFISSEQKEKMIREFTSSKIDVDDEYYFAIGRKDVNPTKEAYLMAKEKEDEDRTPYFDMSEIISYKSIINYWSDDENNLSSIDWNYGFIRDILVKIADRNRYDMMKYHPDFSHFNMVKSFLTAAANFAITNGSKKMDKKEILACFKNWSYVTFESNIRYVDQLFESEQIDYKYHPFRTQKPVQKAKSGIIQFPKAE